MRQDEDLRRIFEELRLREEASAPSFREALARERRPPASTRPISPRFAAAAALLAAGALAAILLLPRPARQTPEREPAATIVDWRSPTEWLLRTPGSPLLEEVPALPDSALGLGMLGDVETDRRKTPTVRDRGRR